MANPFDDSTGKSSSSPEIDEHVVYICEHCGERFDTLRSMAGRLVKCPHCREETLIAGSNDEGSVESVPMAEPVQQAEAQVEEKASNKEKPPTESKEERQGSRPDRRARLKQCPDCDTLVSKRAETCPSCGLRLQARAGVFAIVFWGTISFLTTLFVFLALWVIISLQFPEQAETIKGMVGNPRQAFLLDAESSSPAISAPTSTKTVNDEIQPVVQESDTTPPPPNPPQTTEKTVKFSELLEKAALGDSKFQHAVATIYLDESAQVFDPAKGFMWFKQAAQSGHVESQFQLAYLYFNGRGVEQDLEQAYFWALIAERSGHPTSGQLREGLEAPDLPITAAQRHALKQKADAWAPVLFKE